MKSEQLIKYFDRISEAPDAVVRLRRFILDLAVRGKLVEQDPNDEPAVELLKRIKLEKARLVKQGKIKEPKESISIEFGFPYDLPPNWEWVSLGVTVNSHLGGGTPSKNNSAYWDGDIFWASVKDIGKGKYVDETIDRITEAGLADSSSNLIPPGNLIIVTRMGLGKISINRVPIAINQDLRALSLSSLSAIDYYYIFFKTHGFEGTGLTVKGIKVEKLLNTPFPLPPLAEQHRIVAKVDELMTLCDQLEAAKNEREAQRDRLVAASLHRIVTAPAAADEVATEVKNVTLSRAAARFHLDHLPRLTTRPEHIKQLRQTILDLAVRGHLVPQDPNDEPARELLKRIQKEKEQLIKEKKIRRQQPLPPIDPGNVPFGVPGSWEWCRLGNICFVITDGAHHTPKYEDTGIAFLSVKDVSGGVIDFRNTRFISEEAHRELCKRCKPEYGDILLTKVGTTGIAVTIDVEKEFSIFVSLALLKFSKTNIDRYFLKLLINSPFVKQQSKENTQGIGNKNLVLRLINQFSIPLPPLAEQRRIVTKVDEMMALCDHLEAQLATTQTDSRRLLEAVLHEALSPIHEEVA